MCVAGDNNGIGRLIRDGGVGGMAGMTGINRFWRKIYKLLFSFVAGLLPSAHEGESRGRKRVDLGGGLPVSADNYYITIFDSGY